MGVERERERPGIAQSRAMMYIQEGSRRAIRRVEGAAPPTLEEQLALIWDWAQEKCRYVIVSPAGLSCWISTDIRWTLSLMPNERGEESYPAWVGYRLTC